MMNFVAVHKTLVHCLVKMAGISPQTIEVEPGTVLNIWAPIQSPNTSPVKPAVVLLHGFAGDGVYNWQFQVTSLTKKYSVYVPDLLFFGGSVTDNPDRSLGFQAECMVKGLRKLGVERCTVVGYSYGGFVAYKMAELHPEMVEAVVVTGALPAMTESIRADILECIGFSSFSQFLMPTSAKGCKKLFETVTYRRPWFPNFLFKDFIKVMINHREERAKLLEGFVVNSIIIPKFSQDSDPLLYSMVLCNKGTIESHTSTRRILLLWGEEDKVFNLQLAQSTKRELGSKATFQGIKKAGHLVHLERPQVYNRCLNHFLGSLQSHDEAREIL